MSQVDISASPGSPIASGAGISPSILQRCICYAVLLLVLVGFAAVRFRLRSMPLERDEGEYAYMGQLMLQGIPPYKLASNMKLPGIYAAYAVMMAVFGETASGIHTGMILVTTAAAVLVFLLGKHLYGWLAGTVAGATYAFLAVRPGVLGIEGHATHFVALMAMAGILLLLLAMESGKAWLFFASGLGFGLAFLMKQPGILFGVFGGVYWLSREWKRGLLWRDVATRGGALLAGTVLPYAITCFVLLRAGVFQNFWFWTWSYAREYGLQASWADGWTNLKATLPWAVRPFVLWEFVALGLVAALWSRQARVHRGFVIGFFATPVLAVCPGLYFRPHYFIVLLPAAALCVGVAVDWARGKLQRLGWDQWAWMPGAYFAAVFLIAVAGQWKGPLHLDPISLSRTLAQPYEAETEAVADFIQARSTPHDEIGIIGSEPEICFYTRLHCATTYVYLYPLMERQRFAKQMQDEVTRELQDARPRYLVYLDADIYGDSESLQRTQGFFVWAWSFAHNGYVLVKKVPITDTPHHAKPLWGDHAAMYVFERNSGPSSSTRMPRALRTIMESSSLGLKSPLFFPVPRCENRVPL